jgi:DNA polymerase III delta prime subunit
VPANGITGIILHGATGTGKTTLAKILPPAIEQNKSSDCTTPYVSWHNCEAPDNGVQLINSIRTEISHIATSDSGLHYVVLNEANNLTSSALRQLKTVMEMPNAIFILTTNDIAAFDPALRNRCEEISFNPTDPSIWLPRLRYVLHAELATGSYNDEFLKSVVKTSKFSGRQMLKQMQGLIG